MFRPSEEIKSRLDLVDFVQEYLPLKQAGVNFKANCPFHGEKTPSFIVSRQKQIWHCFGCNEGGDVFQFLMKKEGISFGEALKILARRVGIVLEKENPQIIDERARLLEICELSARYYQQVLLKSKIAEKAREYLTYRGLDQSTVDLFHIGFSPPSQSGALNLNNFLIRHGYSQDDILKAGVAIASQRGFGHFDRFRNRLIFPLHDHHGQVVGFTSRLLPQEEDGMGKYVNTPQTPIYNKSLILYGLHLAKDVIRKKDLAVLVEGNLDVVAAHQSGVSYVVASSGTACTLQQLQQVKRYTRNIAFAFDVDDAGQSALGKAAVLALCEGMEVKVVHLPQEGEWKDPDEYIRSFKNILDGGHAWERCIEAAETYMGMIFSKTCDSIHLDNLDAKKKAAEKMLSLISYLPNKLEREHWIMKLSHALSTSENILLEMLLELQKKHRQISSNFVAGKRDDETIKVNTLQQSSREEKLSSKLIGILTLAPTLLLDVSSRIAIEWLPLPFQTLYKKLVLYYTSLQEPSLSMSDAAHLFSRFRDSLRDAEGAKILLLQLGSASLMVEIECKDYSKEAYIQELRGIINILKKNYLTASIQTAQHKISVLEESNLPVDEKAKLLEKFSFECAHLIEQIKEVE